MEIIKTSIDGVLIIEPRVFKEESLAIDWRIPVEKAILSEKDLEHECLKVFDSPFSVDMDLH